jgi:hypothetical protein
MATSGQTVVLGVIQFAFGAALCVATVWLILHWTEVAEWLAAACRRWGLLREPMRTFEHPLERIAADLRRLAGALSRIEPGTPNVRRVGLVLAYDDTLVAACRALDLPQSLCELPLGLDRELERMRVETALEAAGLRFRPVTH